MANSILLIEAEDDFATGLTRLLESRGATVTRTSDGREGVELAESQRFDAILLSVELPKMSGYTICNSLKKNDITSSIPLVMMSSEATPKTFERHKKLRIRAEEYVIKPCEYSEIIDKIDSLIRLPPVENEEFDTGAENIDLLDDPFDTMEMMDHGLLEEDSVSEGSGSEGESGINESPQDKEIIEILGSDSKAEPLSESTGSSPEDIQKTWSGNDLPVREDPDDEEEEIIELDDSEMLVLEDDEEIVAGEIEIPDEDIEMNESPAYSGSTVEISSEDSSSKGYVILTDADEIELNEEDIEVEEQEIELDADDVEILTLNDQIEDDEDDYEEPDDEEIDLSDDDLEFISDFEGEKNLQSELQTKESDNITKTGSRKVFIRPHIPSEKENTGVNADRDIQQLMETAGFTSEEKSEESSPPPPPFPPEYSTLATEFEEDISESSQESMIEESSASNDDVDRVLTIPGMLVESIDEGEHEQQERVVDNAVTDRLLSGHEKDSEISETDSEINQTIVIQGIDEGAALYDEESPPKIHDDRISESKEDDDFSKMAPEELEELYSNSDLGSTDYIEEPSPDEATGTWEGLDETDDAVLNNDESPEYAGHKQEEKPDVEYTDFSEKSPAEPLKTEEEDAEGSDPVLESRLPDEKPDIPDLKTEDEKAPDDKEIEASEEKISEDPHHDVESLETSDESLPFYRQSTDTEQETLDLPEQETSDLPEQETLDLPEQETSDLPEQETLDMTDRDPADAEEPHDVFEEIESGTQKDAAPQREEVTHVGGIEFPEPDHMTLQKSDPESPVQDVFEESMEMEEASIDDYESEDTGDDIRAPEDEGSELKPDEPESSDMEMKSQKEISDPEISSPENLQSNEKDDEPDISSLIDTSDAGTDPRIGDEDEESSLTELNSNLNRRLSIIEDENAYLIIEKQDLEKTIEELETRISAKNNELEAFRASGAGGSREIIKVKSELTKKSKEILKLKESLNEKEASEVEWQERENELELEIADLKDRLLETEAENKTLLEQTGINNERIEKLQSKLEEADRLSSEKMELETELEKVREEKSEIETARDTALEKVKKEEDNAREAKSRAEELEEEISGLKNKLDETEKDLSDSKEQIEAMQEKLNDFEGLNEQFKALSAENERNENRIVKAYQRLKMAEALREKTRKAVVVALELLDEDISDHEE